MTKKRLVIIIVYEHINANFYWN